MGIETLKSEELLPSCAELKRGGYRLALISCTETKSGMELTYSFDKGYDMVHLRTYWLSGIKIPSIQPVYDCAFVYENEIAELFGVEISSMVIDFNGRLYKTAAEKPFCSGISIQEA